MGNAWFVGGVFGCFEFHHLVACLGLFGFCWHSEPVGIGGESVRAELRIVERKRKIKFFCFVLNLFSEVWFVEVLYIVDAVDVEPISLNDMVCEAIKFTLCRFDLEQIVLRDGVC